MRSAGKMFPDPLGNPGSPDRLTDPLLFYRFNRKLIGEFLDVPIASPPRQDRVIRDTFLPEQRRVPNGA